MKARVTCPNAIMNSDVQKKTTNANQNLYIVSSEYFTAKYDISKPYSSEMFSFASPVDARNNKKAKKKNRRIEKPIKEKNGYIVEEGKSNTALAPAFAMPIDI